MTKTITEREFDIEGGFRTVRAKVDITGYTASGEVLSAGDFGLANLVDVDILDALTDEEWKVRYDTATKALIAKHGQLHATDLFPDAKGGQNADQSADSASAATNGGFVLSLRTAQDETVSSGLTNPDFARNVIVQLKANGGAGTMPTAGTVTVTGTDQFGNSISEEFDISAGSDFGANTIASGEHRWVVGDKVFATVTEVVCDVDGNEANLQYSVGIGTRLGLTAPISATGDIRAVQKDTAAVGSGTYTASASTHSVLMGANMADDVEVYIEYQAKGEPPAGTDVGEVRVKARGY